LGIQHWQELLSQLVDATLSNSLIQQHFPERTDLSGCTQLEPSQSEWRDKGASFLTNLLDNHGSEWRCYMRDPDSHLIEVGQYTQMALDRAASLSCAKRWFQDR